MESQETLNKVIIIASIVVFIFGFVQIGVAIFYHKYYINSKRLDAEKSFREKLDLERNERARIAHDLHDGLQNDFVAIKNYVNLLYFDEHNAERKKYLENLEKSIDLASKNIQDISYSLMPSKLKSIGLIPVINDRFATLSKGSQTYFELEYEDENTNYQIYRIIQEITNNLIKHNKASLCKLSIFETKNKLKLIFKDDGEFFDYKLALNNSKGIGLLGINERLKSMNAKLKQKKDDTENIIIITVEL
jgi:two-component system sensor histidine kinase ComP